MDEDKDKDKDIRESGDLLCNIQILSIKVCVCNNNNKIL